MEQKILAFMKENGIAVFAEANRATGAVHMEKLGDMESWDLFQQLVLYSDVEALCDNTRSHFPFQVWDRETPDVCSPGWMMVGLPCCFSTVSCRGRRSRSGSRSWIRRCVRFIHEQNRQSYVLLYCALAISLILD